MRKVLFVLIACGLFSTLSWAATSSVRQVRHRVNHHVQRHHAHKAGHRAHRRHYRSV